MPESRDASDRAQRDLSDALAQSAFTTMGVLTRLAAEADLSLTQLRVLAILRDRRLRMSDLAEYLGLEKSTLTGLVARAEKRGLLHRTVNATDRRSIDVFLSAEGHALAERLTVELDTRLSPFTYSLSASEQGHLGELLRTLTTTTGPEAPSQARPPRASHPASTGTDQQ